MRFFSTLKIASELGKVPISLPVALSAMMGFTIHSGIIGLKCWILFIGVMFISCGSGALNQFQEKNIDILMPRTKTRPIPSGRITPLNVLLIAAGFFVAGSAILAAVFPAGVFLLSWLTLMWYNLVYTPLKRVTAFAVFPGAITGALPPLIGWIASGGSVYSGTILIVSLFFFLGQIPHFWLLLLLYGDEYSKAGLPNLKRILTESQIKRITFSWIVAAMASSFLVMLKIINDRTLLFVLLFYSFYLLISVMLSFFVEKELRIRSVFLKLNFLYLFMMVFLIVDSLMKG